MSVPLDTPPSCVLCRSHRLVHTHTNIKNDHETNYALLRRRVDELSGIDLAQMTAVQVHCTSGARFSSFAIYYSAALRIQLWFILDAA